MTKELNLSVIIKTFLRPPCLENILQSIMRFQEHHDLRFAEIIIVDDSDEKCQKDNSVIINKYESSLRLLYKAFPFNSVGLSRGRNIAVDAAVSDYILLCDDDFIFDIDCDIDANLSKLRSEKIDILGGYFKDISSLSDIRTNNYHAHNWISYLHETEEEDILILFDNFLPDFSYCFSVQNFFLANKESIRKTRWNENLPMLEHLEFFDRAKKIHGLKVAFTNRLFVRHYHLDMLSTNYKSFREREIDFTQVKKLKGYYISENSVRSFNDYRLTTATNFRKEVLPQNKRLAVVRFGHQLHFQLFFIQIVINASFVHQYLTKLGLLPFFQKAKSFLKNTYLFVIHFKTNQRELRKIKDQFPHVLTTKETLNRLLSEKLSLARFGDGEFKLINGISLGIQGTPSEYQVADPELSSRLQSILMTPPPNLLVSIIPFESKVEDIKNINKGLSFYQNFWIENWPFLKALISTEKPNIFGNANISRKTSFLENTVTNIKLLWEQEDVIFVVGKNSHFSFDERLFNNVKSSEFYHAPSKSAFSHYDTIISDLTKQPSTKLFLISLGPTATVLAADLTQRGYRALDLGHLPNCFQQFLGEKDRPEVEHWK